MVSITQFPSPCGVNIVAKQGKGLAIEVALNVSVPLRGKYRGEDVECFSMLAHTLHIVSVPLRGKYRGEAEKDWL